nr:MAG TPA: hypothetical protein [Caudoviricetes sp.]
MRVAYKLKATIRYDYWIFPAGRPTRFDSL